MPDLKVRTTYVLAILAICCASAPFSAQQPSLDDILARGARYAERYINTLSNVVAEERYEQQTSEVRRQMRMVGVGLQSSPMQTIPGRRRVLRSDVELMSVGPPVGWRTYRDVFEVDGKAVRDRGDRLMQLITQPAPSARAQANRIAGESARFNISDLGRTLNEPGLPIVFLQAEMQRRFQFTLDKRDGDTVWIIKYVERGAPTLFQHNAREDNPSSGRLWIDAVTGEVLRTEHVVTPADMKATFTTDFRRDKTLGVALPSEMREALTKPIDEGEERVQGTARYSNFRRFNVTTGENIPEKR